MSRCIIHVGMQKTGSTSIQYSLAPLDDATHLYADISGRVNHSVAVYSAFARRPERHPKIRQRGLDEAALEAFVRQARQELRNAVERAAGRTLIISGEGLVGLKPGELERLKGFFERRSVDVEIVAYVRGPAGYMSSSFQQRLKSTKISEFDPAQLYPFYRSRFEKFDEVFGRDKVRLWRFDPASFPEGSVVRDFCSRTGIDFAHVQEVRKNDSMSREVAGLLYGYGFWLRENRKPKLFADQAAKLSDLFRELPATRFRLAPSVVRPILADRCFACHGPDKAEGGLRMNSAEGLSAKLDSGAQAIVAGKPDESEVVHRISATDEGVRMPHRIRASFDPPVD